jgi:glycine betaine/proline transport system permease protein
MTALQDWCEGTRAQAPPPLFPPTDGFPSLDAMHAACPTIPPLRALERGIDDGYRAFSRRYGSEIEEAVRPFLDLLVGAERLALSSPWWLTIAALTLLTLVVSRSLGLAMASALLLCVVGLLGLWSDAMITVSLMAVCMVVVVALGIPAGVVVAKVRPVRRLSLPVLDAMQTLPSFVYLIPVVMLLGVGKLAGAAAVITYAMPPVIRLTDLGLRTVPAELREAAADLGATRWRILWMVELPLAALMVAAGINQSIMMSLAMVVIASMVGVGGLGLQVLQAVTNQYLAQGLFSGGAVVVIAILFDRLTQSARRQRPS